MSAVLDRLRYIVEVGSKPNYWDAKHVVYLVRDVLSAAEVDAQALADVRTLIAWRKQAPMIRQWVVGSRFAQVHCCLQEQGEDVVAPFYGTDEADAMAKAAAWVREQKP